MNVTAWLERELRDQKAWMQQCGGDLAGYVAKYGSREDPTHYGDGGEAIYEADRAVLIALEQRLAVRRPQGARAAARVWDVTSRAMDRVTGAPVMLYDTMVPHAERVERITSDNPLFPVTASAQEIHERYERFWNHLSSGPTVVLVVAVTEVKAG